MLNLRVTNYPARGRMAAHHHEEASLIVVVGGVYLERIQGAERQHGVGHMLFYPAFTTHSQCFGAEGARKLVFTPEASWLEYLREHGMSLEAARHVESAAVSQLAQRALAEMRHGDTFAPLAVKGILLELVAAFGRKEQAVGLGGPPLWLREAREYIRENAERNPSVESMAARAGKHPVHLAKEFRRYFGTSIGAYVRQTRLEQAQAMLLRKDVDLTEVALACGFASHSHLCRSFKAAYGVTPSEYRARRE